MRPGESPDGQERRRRRHRPTFLPEGQATQDVEFSPMSRGIASHRGPGTPAEQSHQSPVATGGGGLDPPPDYAVRSAMEAFLQNMAQVVGEQWEYGQRLVEYAQEIHRQNLPEIRLPPVTKTNFWARLGPFLLA